MIHLVLSLLLAAGPAAVFAQEDEAPVEAPKKKPKKKEEKPSKYRFKSVEPTESTYRFNAETGEPIVPASKKKKAQKKVSTPDDEIDGIVPPEDCGESADVCSAPKNG